MLECVGFVSTSVDLGNVAWYFEQDSVPIQLDCGIVDANQDGHLDCLVVDLKVTLSPIFGQQSSYGAF